MTAKTFRESPFRNQLFEFLKTDCGHHLLSLIERKPSELPSINGIHHTDAVVARMYAFDAGVNKAVDILKSLAEPWVDQSEMSKASERPAWSDQIPAQMREAFEKFQREQSTHL